MTVGRRIIQLSWAGTAVFVVVTAAALTSLGAFEAVTVATDLILLLVGCVAFGVGFSVAVGRSRTEDVTLPGLFALQDVAPRRVRLHLLGATALQAVVGVAAAASNPYTALAFGVLTPVYGLGLAVLWAARHGEFRPRPAPGRSVRMR